MKHCAVNVVGFLFFLLSSLAMSHLNGQKVFGKVMRVTLSKHQTVALPREGLDDQLLTKGKRVYLHPGVTYLWCQQPDQIFTGQWQVLK